MDISQFPFLTREMLDFGSSTQIGIRVNLMSTTTEDLELSGFSRAGHFEFKIEPSSNSLATNFNFSLTDIPIFLRLSTVTNNVSPGEVYAGVFLTFNGEVVACLGQGPVYASYDIRWPGGADKESTDTRGRIYGNNQSAPGAGNNFSATVPTNHMWLLKAIHFTFAADSNVATRIMHIQVEDAGGETVLDHFCDRGTVADGTTNYTFMDIGALNDTLDDDDALATLPHNLLLPEGFIIKSAITNIQVGDAITNLNFYIEDWLMDDAGPDI